MITYDTGGGGFATKNIDFFIPFATLNSATTLTLTSQVFTAGYVCPISFFCYNYTNDTIDKVIFKSVYLNNDYTHEQNVLPDTPTLLGFFNQGLGAPTYSPIAYSSSQILVNWSNLGHTYTTKGLYIRIFYYISKKFW